MSRVSLIEQLYAPKRKSALEFEYDKLWAPPIRALLSQQDINQLYKIATSLKYNGNIEKKYELIDAVMRPRGFRRGNRGTNRVVYNFLEDTSFCMKIALDRVGIKDSPAEFKNQEFFKPFCCKIFEVDPTGVIACIERVNPISSLEEFISVSDDVFNMMVTKIIGKYVVDDLGTEKFMNYGMRYNSNGVAFGPVVIDFPYAYELDGAKLRCNKPIPTSFGEIPCGGEIDYDAGMNNLICTKCGKPYSAKELGKNDSNVIKFYTDEDQAFKRTMRARIVRESDNAILYDSGRSSNVYVSIEEYKEGNRLFNLDNAEPRKVVKTVKSKYKPMKQLRREYYSELQLKAYEEMQKREDEPFNPVLTTEASPRSARRATSKDRNESYDEVVAAEDTRSTELVTRAKRAEDTVTVEIKVAHTEANANKTSVCMHEDSIREDHDTLKGIVDHISFHDEAIINNDLNSDNHSCVDITTPVEDIDFGIKFKDKEHDNLEEQPESDEEENHDKESVFDEELEKTAFPELNNSDMLADMNNDEESETTTESSDSTGMLVGVTSIEDEPDYSNYIPNDDEDQDYDDESEDEAKYASYYKEDRKASKRNNKKQKKSRNVDYDMSEY